jgi:hypothetical protein
MVGAARDERRSNGQNGRPLDVTFNRARPPNDVPAEDIQPPAGANAFQVLVVEAIVIMAF